MYSLYITMIFYVSIITFFQLLVLKISLDHTVTRTTIYKSSYQTDFLVRGLLLTRKLLIQGHLVVKLKSLLG